MNPISLPRRIMLAAATLALATTTPLFAAASRPMDRVSPAIQVANDRGPLDANQQIRLTVHLAGDQAGLDKAIADLYDPASPRFHKWMTDADLKKFAPTPEQFKLVQQELEGHGLSTLSSSSDGFSLRVTGRVSDVEAAFHTQLHQFEHNSKLFRANITPAHLSPQADQYVSSVAGLESHAIHPLLKRAINLRTGKPYASYPLGKHDDLTTLQGLITSIALTHARTYSLDTPGSSLPVGVYYGNQYNSDINQAVDFDASHLEAAYGLPAVYRAGYSGKGETIVLVEGYGDDTIQADVNTFSKLNNLPRLTSENYQIIYPEGKPKDPNAAAETGWDGEIALDTQWAHAVAPDAKIVVIATNGQDSEDFQASLNYVTDHLTGYAVSNSWEEDQDNFAGPAEMQSFEDVLKLAAAKGISVGFSTGDGGDGGLGTPVGAPGVPSDAPHAVAVGGTAILNNPGNQSYVPAGWGDSLVVLDAGGVLDPPQAYGFVGGGGGGESVYFPKPSWQKSLPGTGRQTPDVSALADPYTGVPIVLTIQGSQYVEVGVGGTSLASPIFAAIWALADQKAGWPLGQASPLIAGLPAGGVVDVLPTTDWNLTNPTGTVVDSNGATFYSAKDLFSSLLENTTGFTSGVWNLTQNGSPIYYDFGFGLDSSLAVAKGWDNVTGYGTPYGLDFLNAVTAEAKSK